MTRDQIAVLLRAGRTSISLADDVDDMRLPHAAALTPAAVLIALIDRVEGTTVLFTQRTAHLNDHAGQISFPGGRAEPDDLDPTHTALREAEEEVGLPRQRVEVLGDLPTYATGTGFLVTPVVGWIEPPVEYKPDPFEVAEVFEVPFSFLMDPANHRLETAFLRGRQRSFYVMPYGDRIIWGATAGMLVLLQRALSGTGSA